MYKTIEIGGREYRQEYTIEASMNHECVEKLITFMTSTAVASSVDTTGMNESDAIRAAEEAAKEGIRAMSDLPSVAMHVWYAGFLEYHGPEGDGTVRTLRDAKNLYKQYKEEHPDESSFYDIVSLCVLQMEADGFFEQIGLSQMFTPDEPKKKPRKTPQDHKRKATPMA